MAMKPLKTIALFALFSLILVGTASAAQQTRLNISVSETIYQNVTFAQNFDLTESQTFCRIIGLVNITNPGDQPIADIYLNFSNTDNHETNFTHVSGRNGSQVSGVNPGDIFVIHVTELRPNDYSAYNYSVNCSSVPPPIDLSTTYANTATGINKKVLAGDDWTINQSLANTLAIMQNITDVNITLVAQNVTWNATSDSFVLADLLPYGDYSNVTNATTSHWWWTPNGGTLEPSATPYIVFNMTAPNAVPTSNTYQALKETLSYRLNQLASNMSLDAVSGISDVEFSLNKRIVQPADNQLSNNVTWEVYANVSVPFNISLNLSQVSLWVTSDLDPTHIAVFGGKNLTTNISVGQEINQTTSWQTSDTANWRFNYTDASNNISARPPIVWMQPYFTILDAYGQIVNSSLTRNGEDYYMKYIYVVNGYWLQIDKNITNVGNDQYHIFTKVQNIGNAPTPSGLVVTVYDFVPAEFTAWNWSGADNGLGSYDSTSAVSGGSFNGTSYRWTIAPKGIQNASLYAVPATNSTWNVSYTVNGSGDYKVSELYIVGLDPRKVEGAGTHEGITVKGGFASASGEMFYMGIVLFLIIINIVNFVMTRRINDKLNRQHKK